MAEFFQMTISGVNIIPTLLLVVSMLYWLIVILGVVDMDGLGIDIDLDADAIDAHIINFFNLGDVPIPIYSTLVFIFFWMLNMTVSALTGSMGGIPNIIGIVPCFIGAALITKIITQPFNRFFRELYGNADESKDFIGMTGVLKFDIKAGKTSQVIIDNGSTLINCYIEGDIELPKGANVTVVSKDKEKNKYLIKPFQE